MKSMKLLFTLLFVAAFATVGLGQVAGTAHNLSAVVTDANMPGSFAGEICAACHIPHGSLVGTGELLWSSAIPVAGTFTMYTSATYPTAGDLTATGVSLKCLGCHDDATAIHASGTITEVGFAALGDGDGDVGVVLTNDHPVGVTLTALAGSMQVPVTAKTFTGGLNEYVECGSCHNPHDDTNASFLIMSNDASALCLDCHLK